MCGVDVCDWFYGCKCVECMYTYVSLWVINDKTRVDIEWRRGGAPSGTVDGGNRDVCTGNRDTRVVKVNGMSTAFRGVSLCHSWTYASYWNGGNVDVKITNRAGGRAVQTNRRRRESSRGPPCRSIVVTRRRSRRSFALVVVASERSLASRVNPFASRRVVVSRSSERTIEYIHPSPSS